MAIGAMAALLCAWLTVSDAAGTPGSTKYVSSHPDAWSYDAVGGYLADHGRTRTNGMPLVDQYASHLRDTRFSSSCLLALIQSPLGPERKFTVHTLFYLLVVLVTFCSLTALTEAMGFDRPWATVTAAAAVLLGWTTNAILIGNYDNLCFAALLPAALALVIHVLTGKGRSEWTVTALGLITAAILYSYPEGAALSGPAILPMLVVLLMRSTERLLALRNLLAAAVAAVLLWLPYAPYFLGFVANQMGSTVAAAARPGSGNFTGLLSPRALPSVFALGSEYPTANASWWSFSLAVVLLGLLLVGAWRLTKLHPWFACSVVAAALLFVWQSWGRQYDYGAYKVVYCHAWLIYPALVAGARYFWQLLPKIAAIGVLAGLVAGVVGERWHHRPDRVWRPAGSLAALSGLAEIRGQISGTTTFVELRGDFDQMWAITFLRGLPLIVGERRGYLAMPHVQSLLNLAAPVSTDGEAFVLGDQPEPGAVWNNSRFHLSRIEGARLVEVQNPNGVEMFEGRTLIWIAHSRETRLSISVNRAGRYELAASTWWGGPSLPGISRPTLVVADATHEYRVPLDFPDPHIPLQLAAGINIIRLRVEEPPTVAVQPNGDTRELMLGLLGYYLKPVSP